MDKIEKIKSAVLKKIKPSIKEEKLIEEFNARLIKVCTDVSGYDCIICGSIGKATWLKGDHDIDVFILFPKDVPRKELEQHGLESGKRIAKELGGKYKIKYAEHPYVNIEVPFKKRLFNADIVPCYRIHKGEKIKSAVDRSPLHLEYVLNNLEKTDEARLLKQFCKGIGVYGSDAKNLGFSGYVCELLVIKYGSFENVLKAAMKWHPQEFIVLKLCDYSEIEMKKFRNQPLVLIDPTDTSRNAAANISSENMIKFIEKCKEFMKSPSESYFWPRLIPLTKKEMMEIKNRKTIMFSFQMKKPDVIDDILYSQLRRMLSRLKGLLSYYDFRVIRAYEWVDKDVIFFFEIQSSLPPIEKFEGPSVFSKKHTAQFLSKYKSAGLRTFVEGNKWFVERRRKYTHPRDVIKDLSRKSEKELKAEGIPSNFVSAFKKLSFKDPWKLLKNRKFSSYIREKYFS